MPLCNQVEYGKRKGFGPGRVNRMVKSGILDAALRNIGGRRKPFIDTDVADQIIKDLPYHWKVDIEDPAEKEKPVKEKKESLRAKHKALPEEKEKVISKGKSSVLSYPEARTMHERYRAALKKLQFEERSGQLVLAENVQKQAFTLGRQVRDAILNVPDRIASILAAEKDERKIKEILDKELGLALEALSGGRI